MRILQIYELNPFESIGGIETAIASLSMELVKLGHEVTVLTGEGRDGQPLQREGVEVKVIKGLGLLKKYYSPGQLTMPRQAIFYLANRLGGKGEVYDIYHGHVYISGLVAKDLSRENGGASVNTVHGSYYPVWRQLTNPLMAFFYRTMERHLATHLSREADLQIHVSSYFADQVREWGGSPVVIQNGVDTDLFNPGVEGILDPGKVVILTARRLVKKNGVEHLIRALNYLEHDAKLLVIGDGPERRGLERLSKGLDVDFLGQVPHGEMPRYIASADAAIIPSLIEASSLFMLEAMAMEKPVIATHVGGLPEALGDSGMLVPPGDAEALASGLDEILSDPENAGSTARRARRRVEENFTWEKIARKVEEEYRSLLDKKSGK